MISEVVSVFKREQISDRIRLVAVCDECGMGHVVVNPLPQSPSVGSSFKLVDFIAQEDQRQERWRNKLEKVVSEREYKLVIPVSDSFDCRGCGCVIKDVPNPDDLDVSLHDVYDPD